MKRLLWVIVLTIVSSVLARVVLAETIPSGANVSGWMGWIVASLVGVFTFIVNMRITPTIADVREMKRDFDDCRDGSGKQFSEISGDLKVLKESAGRQNSLERKVNCMDKNLAVVKQTVARIEKKIDQSNGVKKIEHN